MDEGKTLLYRANDAAEVLNTSVRTIYRLVSRGDLKAIRVGGPRGLRIHRSELERFASTAESTRSSQF
jgi:excisionase family DNA binding protein